MRSMQVSPAIWCPSQRWTPRREEAAQWASDRDHDDQAFLPWQVGGEAIQGLPGSVRAWRLGRAQMVFQESDTVVSVPSLLEAGPGLSDARRLLEALRFKFPERSLRAPQLHRKNGAARAFEDSRWERMALHQLLMRRRLRA